MKHNIIMIFRQFKRRLLINCVNLFGLAIGMAAVIILATHCFSELTTDSHHVNGDNVYLLLGEREQTSGIIHAMHTPGILKEHIDMAIPQVSRTVRVAETWDPPVFQVENRDAVTSQLIFADRGFFDLFTYPVIAGNIETALDAPNSLVLMASEAERLFGTTQAVGQMVKIDNAHLMTVTAVVDHAPRKSCLSFPALAPVSAMEKLQDEEGLFTSWWNLNFQTFVLIENNERLDDIEASITRLFPTNLYNNENTTASLFPFRKIYFSQMDVQRKHYIQLGDLNNIFILLLVSMLILCMAVFNYINIASANRLERLKNIGVQKMIGASRKRIFGEILYEAAAIFAISLFMAWILAIEFSPVITHITGISFSKSLLNSPVSFTLSFLVAIVLSFMASLIPAWRMASSDPVFNLKKQQSASRNKSAAREYLVVSQFAVAIVLIAFTLLIQKQIRFGSKNLGFDKENILVIKITDQLSGKIDVLRQYFSEQPLVRKLSFSQFYPGKEFSSWRVPLKENGEEKQVTFNIFSSDANFFDLMETVLVQGRYFTNDISTDRNKVVVNEAFVKQYEMTDPIGSTFNDGQNEIIGVVKDFHYMPVNKPIEPLAIVCKEWASTCLARPAKNEYAVLHPFLENVKKKCAELSPAFPVEIHFLDTAVENMYRQEVQFRRTFTLFAGCAMFICCLGMLALSLIVSQQRIKEIGIRKIVGATSGEIVYLLLSHSLKWVGIAFLIASPVAWYMMNRWLQNFVYRTSVSWWLFILAGLFTLVIAVLTVSWQAVKAARANPANSLKYE